MPRKLSDKQRKLLGALGILGGVGVGIVAKKRFGRMKYPISPTSKQLSKIKQFIKRKKGPQVAKKTTGGYIKRDEKVRHTGQDLERNYKKHKASRDAKRKALRKK